MEYEYECPHCHTKIITSDRLVSIECPKCHTFFIASPKRTVSRWGIWG